MDKCVLCGKTVLMKHEVYERVFCNGCYLKLHIPLWENKTYNSVSELDNQEKKVIEILKKGNYNLAGANEVLSIFENKKENGFLKSLDGGLGQIIELYSSYCTIITKSSFDQDTMSKDYAMILKTTKPQTNKTKETLKTFANKGLIGGGISLAANYAIDQGFPDKEGFALYEGAYDIYYESLNRVDLLPSSSETSTRIMRLTMRSGDEVLFFYTVSKSKKVTLIQKDITNGIKMIKNGGVSSESLQSKIKHSNSSAMIQSEYIQTPVQSVQTQTPSQPMPVQTPIQTIPVQTPMETVPIQGRQQPAQSPYKTMPMQNIDQSLQGSSQSTSSSYRSNTNYQQPLQNHSQNSPSPYQSVSVAPQPMQSVPQPIHDQRDQSLSSNDDTMINKTSNIDENIEMIRKYKTLFDEGIISEEEFSKKKKELLGL